MWQRVTDQDKFGHPINFNFNRQGNTYKTCMGGCCSIAVNIFMVVYVLVHLKKLMLNEGG